MAGKHWIVLYISSHLSSAPRLSFTKNRVHGRDNAMCVRRLGPRDLASILTVTHVTDARETRDHPGFSLLRMTWILVRFVWKDSLRWNRCSSLEDPARSCVSTGKRVANVAINVLNSPQDIQGFLDSLPSYVSDLPLGQDNSHRDFKVRRTRAYDALVWLRDNNRFYQDIHINMDAVSSLPEDSVPEELLTVEEQDDPDDPSAMPDSSVVDQIMTEIDEWHFSQDSAASGDRQEQQQQQQQQQQRQQQQLQQQAVMLTEEDNLETMSKGDMFSRSDHDDAGGADDTEETPADMDTRSFIPLPLQQDREGIQPSGLQSMGKIPWHGQMSVESQ